MVIKTLTRPERKADELSENFNKEIPIRVEEYK